MLDLFSEMSLDLVAPLDLVVVTLHPLPLLHLGVCRHFNLGVVILLCLVIAESFPIEMSLDNFHFSSFFDA